MLSLCHFCSPLRGSLSDSSLELRSRFDFLTQRCCFHERYEFLEDFSGYAAVSAGCEVQVVSIARFGSVSESRSDRRSRSAAAFCCYETEAEELSVHHGCLRKLHVCSSGFRDFDPDVEVRSEFMWVVRFQSQRGYVCDKVLTWLLLVFFSVLWCWLLLSLLLTLSETSFVWILIAICLILVLSCPLWRLRCFGCGRRFQRARE